MSFAAARPRWRGRPAAFGPPIKVLRLTSRRAAQVIPKLAERDGWDCWLCRDKLDPSTPRDDEAAASIDHVIPIADGGSNQQHNLRLAHRACNTLRGDNPKPEPPPGKSWPSFRRRTTPGLAGPRRTER